MIMRENIRKATKVEKENSFYDVFKKRSYKDNKDYKLVAGITKAEFSKKK